jgi:transcriptional regulator with XRE-family HTH domain
MARKPPKKPPRVFGAEDHVKIGRRLRAARLQADVNQTQLGAMLGVSFQQIQKYENGSNRMDVSRLMKAAELLNVSIDYLLGKSTGSGQTSDFDEVLASKEGFEVVAAMIDMNRSQRAFLASMAKQLPRVTTE